MDKGYSTWIEYKSSVHLSFLKSHTFSIIMAAFIEHLLCMMEISSADLGSHLPSQTLCSLCCGWWNWTGDLPSLRAVLELGFQPWPSNSRSCPPHCVPLEPWEEAALSSLPSPCVFFLCLRKIRWRQRLPGRVSLGQSSHAYAGKILANTRRKEQRQTSEAR